MHSQEGMSYFILLKLKCSVLSILRICMGMTLSFLIIFSLVMPPKMDNLATMTICLKKKILCVPKGSIRELLVWEAHEEGLMRAFWRF